MIWKLHNAEFFSRSLLLVLAVSLLLVSGAGCDDQGGARTSSLHSTPSSEEAREPQSTAESSAVSSGAAESKRIGEYDPPYGIKTEWGHQAIGMMPLSEGERTIGWFYIDEELPLDLLDVCFTVPAAEERLSYSSLKYINRSYTVPFWKRTNALPYGLNQFCPTLSFVYPLERPIKENGGKWKTELDTFIDIHVRRKDSAVGENFSDLTSYIGQKAESNIALLTETTESYHDAADFYEKNFSKAEAGQDGNYVKFTRLPDQEIGGTTAYHYSFERNPDAAPPVVGADQYHVEEQYGEQYLFETERYIYVFAYSGQLPLEGYEKFYEERDGKAQELFRGIVEGIEFKTDASESSEPPVWANNAWIQEHISGTPEKVLAQLKEAKELRGELPECVKELLEEAE